MTTPQTQKAVEEQLRKTEQLVRDYKRRAGEYWRKQRFINLRLLSGIIFEVVVVFTIHRSYC